MSQLPELNFKIKTPNGFLGPSASEKTLGFFLNSVFELKTEAVISPGNKPAAQSQQYKC